MQGKYSQPWHYSISLVVPLLCHCLFSDSKIISIIDSLLEPVDGVARVLTDDGVLQELIDLGMSRMLFKINELKHP